MHEYHEAIFLKNNFFGQKWRKTCENMHFRAFLGNQSIHFSDFWNVTRLIYYFKYGIGSFARKKGRKWCKKYAQSIYGWWTGTFIWNKTVTPAIYLTFWLNNPNQFLFFSLSGNSLSWSRNSSTRMDLFWNSSSRLNLESSIEHQPVD